MTLVFDSDGFAELRRSMVQPMRENASAALSQAAAVGSVSLPRRFAAEQRQINQILAQIPSALAQLQSMTEIFDDKMAQTAEAFDQVDHDVTARMQRLSGEMP